MSRTHHFRSRIVQTFNALAKTLSSQIRHTDVGTAHMSRINHSAWWSGWNPSPRILPPLARVANWTSRPNPQATGSPPPPVQVMRCKMISRARERVNLTLWDTFKGGGEAEVSYYKMNFEAGRGWADTPGRIPSARLVNHGGRSHEVWMQPLLINRRGGGAHVPPPSSWWS